MGCIYKRKERTADGSVRELPTLWIKYYRNGRPFYESARTTKEGEAKRLLQVREGEIARGAPVSPSTGRLRFEEAAADVVNDYRVNGKRSLRNLEGRIAKHLAPFFGGRRMADVSTADVRTYVAGRQEASASNAEVNRELAILKRAFTLAIQAGKLMHRPYIPMLREDNVRTGFFEREQLENVRSRLPEPLRSVVRFAYITGWRVQSEVLSLQWRQVDLSGGTVRLDPGTTKNREGRVFPLTAELHALLEAQRATTEQESRRRGTIIPWVFHRAGQPIRDFRHAWVSACKAGGCPGRLVHDLRRTAIRNLVRAGIPERVAMQMTGHKTRSVFERYNIVSEGDLREAAQRLSLYAAR